MIQLAQTQQITSMYFNVQNTIDIIIETDTDREIEIQDQDTERKANFTMVTNLETDQDQGANRVAHGQDQNQGQDQHIVQDTETKLDQEKEIQIGDAMIDIEHAQRDMYISDTMIRTKRTNTEQNNIETVVINEGTNEKTNIKTTIRDIVVRVTTDQRVDVENVVTDMAEMSNVLHRKRKETNMVKEEQKVELMQFKTKVNWKKIKNWIKWK
ncbi:MAG: hypothetical protein ACPG2Y_01500 [Acholeplasmataceae bacterium]